MYYFSLIWLLWDQWSIYNFYTRHQYHLQSKTKVYLTFSVLIFGSCLQKPNQLWQPNLKNSLFKFELSFENKESQFWTEKAFDWKPEIVNLWALSTWSTNLQHQQTTTSERGQVFWWVTKRRVLEIVSYKGKLHCSKKCLVFPYRELQWFSKVTLISIILIKARYSTVQFPLECYCNFVGGFVKLAQNVQVIPKCGTKIPEKFVYTIFCV